MAITVPEIGITQSTTTRTLSYPLTPGNGGDVLVVVVICQSSGATSAGVATPTDWALLATETGRHRGDSGADLRAAGRA